MDKPIYKILQCTMIVLLSSCANLGARFYDSAINDHNRAPASFDIPVVVQSSNESDNSSAVPTIDFLHNQSKADYLFMVSELEAGAGRSSEAIELLKSALIYDSSSPTLMQKLAIEYYKKGQAAEALSWAQKALAINSEKRDINLLVAGLLTTSKNYEAAEAIYKKMINKDNHDYEAQLYLGAVYTEVKNYTLAIQTFKKLSLLKKNSSKHLAHYYLARVYAEQNSKQDQKVQTELARAIEAKPDFIEAIAMMGQYIQKNIGLSSTIAFYEKIQKKHGPQIKIAEILAQQYIAQNQYDKAYEQLSIIDEGSDDAVQVKLKMALILIDKKVYDRAIYKLNEILTIAPESDKVRFYLSAVYEEQKDYQRAFDNYLKIEKASSYFEESRLHAANVSKIMGNIEQSVVVLSDALGLKGETPQVAIFLSQIFEEKKDLAASLATLKVAVKKFEDNSQVHYYLGLLQDKMNLKSEMVISMKKVIDLKPDHSQALNFLAYTWAETGENLDQAEAYAKLAVLNEKNDAFILDTLGWVLYKKGNFKKAVEVLEKAHSLQPEASIISEHLGDVYMKLNKVEKARAQFIKAETFEADLSRKQLINNKLISLESEFKVQKQREPASIQLDSNTPSSQ